MSTSGSTGCPKLVGLSRRNLVANAVAIAEYLEIHGTDSAATTLPMSYCYGLSVIHSHLLVGAALILTEQSVADAAFWDLFRRHRGTASSGPRNDRLDRDHHGRDPAAQSAARAQAQPAGVGGGSRSAMSPSWTRVAATRPSWPIRLAVTTPRPPAAAGERHSSRFH